MTAAFAESWLRMWNEDSDLAHELITDDGRMWSGRGPGLDDVVGPAASAAFVTHWRETVGPRFTARVVVDDGAGLLAYTWDATLPDGTVVTGIDANVLHGSRVAENWTLSAPGRAPLPDPEPEPADPAVVTDLLHRWIVEPDGAVTRDAAVWSGDDRPVVGLALHRDTIVDAARGRAAATITAETPEGRVGGIAVLAVRGGRIAAVWSILGVRGFTF